MRFRLVREFAADGIAVAVACRVLDEPRQLRVTDGAHKELAMGQGVRCSRKRIERLMRYAGLHGSYRRKGHRAKPLPPVHDDLVARRFAVDRPNKLWVCDITEHPTREGKVYLAVVIDAFSRRVIGHAIADHLRSEIVVDALEMARWRRGAAKGLIVHSDHGTRSVNTSWVFSERLRQSGLLPSMGAVGSAYDNAAIESFRARMQVELLNRKKWNTRVELANAMFEYLEVFHNRQRRHSALGMLTPVEYEKLHAEREDVA